MSRVPPALVHGRHQAALSVEAYGVAAAEARRGRGRSRVWKAGRHGRVEATEPPGRHASIRTHEELAQGARCTLGSDPPGCCHLRHGVVPKGPSAASQSPGRGGPVGSLLRSSPHRPTLQPTSSSHHSPSHAVTRRGAPPPARCSVPLPVATSAAVPSAAARKARRSPTVQTAPC